MLTIEKNDEMGYFMLLDDDCGICKSKSRNALVRIRDALNAVRKIGLVGLTVENHVDTMGTRINGFECGVVLALANNRLIVRLPDDRLDEWYVGNCQVVEPPSPAPTPWNDPAIGVLSAVELLRSFLTFANDVLNTVEPVDLDNVGRRGIEKIIADTEAFLAARKAAEPVP